jgi:hydroxyethylthiazole kinase-like uncharacterized protein yjeF
MHDADSTPPLPPPIRPADGHKGTFGTVGVIGGSCDPETRMLGAPVLAGRAALRSGCGLVKLAVPKPLATAAIVMLPSATCHPIPTAPDGSIHAHRAAETVDRLLTSCDVIAVGPGLGASRGGAAATLRCIQQQDRPVVIDADSINALAATPELHADFRCPAILTPHPGECKRLATALRTRQPGTTHQSRCDAAADLARTLGCVVVLKGAGTIVSDGRRAWTCPRGHACLATGGSGDVLTGLIAGLLAQHPSRGTPDIDLLYEIARTAVESHAHAGERWALTHHASAGMLAEELADGLPTALEDARRAARP